MTELSGAELRRFRAGASSELRRLVQEHTPVLFDWLRGLGVPREDRDDVAQEVWIRVLRARRTYRGSGSFRGWLYRIARNAALDRARTETARAARERGASPAGDGAQYQPSDRLGTAEVERLLAQLTDRQRDVVVLRVLVGSSTTEAAEELGCAPGTIKATLSQALAKLRRVIADENRRSSREEGTRE